MCICKNCIHRDVCGEEGVNDPALKFCADYLIKPANATWDYYGTCSNCGRMTSSDKDLIAQGYRYCPFCGSNMQGSGSTINYL